MRGMFGKKFIISICICLLVVAAYLGMANLYSSGFTLGTWINGIYCTGKSIDQVNQLLTDQYDYQGCSIVFTNQESETFTIQDAQTTFDFKKELQSIQYSQKPYLWAENVVRLMYNTNNISMNPTITVDQNSFKTWFYSLPEVTSQVKMDRHVKITKTAADGYILDNTKWNSLDVDKAYELCLAQIESGAETIVLKDFGCYSDLPMTQTEEDTIALYDKLNSFLNFQLTYDMGDQNVVYGHAALSNLIATSESSTTDFIFDEDGNFTWDDEKIAQLISQLANQFDTYQKTREFQTTRGDVVQIDGGTYGNEINQKSEQKYLSNALLKHQSETHIPTYKREAYVRGKNDIGDSYIEIDLTNQEMYCYIDGTLQVTTPIVTGNMMLHRDTPEGVYYVYSKQKNRILKGPNYTAHVNFWMPIVRGIGIHDALWRDEFGGTIYQKSGSHGCINTPYDAMVELYDMTEVGMPVVLYH